MKKLNDKFEFLEFEDDENLSMYTVDSFSCEAFLKNIDIIEIHSHIEILSTFLNNLETLTKHDRLKVKAFEDKPLLHCWEYVSSCGATVRFIPSRWDYLKNKLAIKTMGGDDETNG